jgi:formate-dependent nitrite reductase membrane component NrfD
MIAVLCSPIVGAIMGMAVAKTTIPSAWLIWLLGITGGLFALVLQLVQTGWFYRLKRVPLWILFAQDFLCVALVFLAFDAPRQGGLIALLLLWLAIRSSKDWHHWYRRRGRANDRHASGRQTQEPD